jgi:hypothetical protein
LVHQTYDGWKFIIVNNNDKVLDKMSQSNIFKIQRKSKYLSHVINAILKSYHCSTLKEIYQTVAKKVHSEEFFDEVEEIDFDNSVPLHYTTKFC